MNKQDYEKLRQNLVKHHVDCIGNASTSHPIFMIQKQKVIWGLDSESCYNVSEIYDEKNETSYASLEDFFKEQDEDFDKEVLPELLGLLSIDLEDDYDLQEYGSFSTCFEVWQKYQEEEGLLYEDNIIHYLEDVHKIYGKLIWEDFTMFLDRDAAEEFLANFRYRHGKMRIYVRSGWESQQYRDLISAMIEGKLVWNEEDS